MSAAQDLRDVLFRQLDELVRAVVAQHSDPAVGPVVESVPFTVDRDWSGDDAVHFTVILADPPSGKPYDIDALTVIRDDLYDRVHESGIERLPYTTFKLRSEIDEADAERADTEA